MATQAQTLLDLAESAEYWHSADRVAYATLCLDTHEERHRVRSGVLRQWLVHGFYALKGKPPGSQAVQAALEVLEARALFDGPQREVFTRVGHGGGALYLDLVNEDWGAVEVTGAGWRVIARPPVPLVRAPGMAALPIPERGGTLDDLERLLNVAGKSDARLLIAWLLAALRPIGPYPILILQGEQGSAKSTTARLLRNLIDPSTAPLRSPPRDERDLIIGAMKSWVLALDNVSLVRPWLSDAMCRLSTGGGWSTRQLYTDADEVLFEGQRPLLLNGIEELATRDDLRDRALIINLPQIPDASRKSERGFWSDFELARPMLLGALLDGVSAALREEPRVKVPSLPRMADFARWICAAEEGLGWSQGSFLVAYAANRHEAVQLSAEFNPVATAIVELIEKTDTWEGTAGELLVKLTEVADSGDGPPLGWPRTPRSMSNALNRAAATIRRLDIVIERLPRTSGRRLMRLRKSREFNVTTVIEQASAGPRCDIGASLGDTGDDSDGPDGQLSLMDVLADPCPDPDLHPERFERWAIQHEADATDQWTRRLTQETSYA
jgi:hypothetical protein